MLNKISYLFFLFCWVSFSQKTIQIKGRVFGGDVPLNGAAVYINNSMLGTTTNENGEFTLSITQKNVELIVSYLGFETLKYDLDSNLYQRPIKFVLVEKEEFLKEIVLKKIKYDEEWQFNLKQFINEFIGKSEFAKYCKITNPKTLFFNFDKSTNELTAFAKEPLLIKNDALGYDIYFDLISFKKNSKSISYAGYTRFVEQKGNERKKQKWIQNRLIAYNGTVTHFLKSCIENNLLDSGFIVHQFKRVANKERPSDETIENARTFLKTAKISFDFTKKISNPETKLDSAIVVLQKSSLPKYQDYLYKSNLQESDIITKNDELYELTFSDNLQILYKNEPVDPNYRIPFKKVNYNQQDSMFLPIEKPIYVDKNGNLVNPLQVFYEGYWAFEKFAFTLPLDYKPIE